MPPHFPVEDNIFETKEWASTTIDNLFSNSHPISFEPSRPYAKDYKSEPMIRTINNLRMNINNPARRSVSVLETNLFNRYQDENKVDSWATSSLRPATTSPLMYSDSAPSLLITHQTTPVSLSARLKRTLTPDKPHMSKKHLGYKEKEGVSIWKSTFQQYLTDSKMVSIYRKSDRAKSVTSER